MSENANIFRKQLIINKLKRETTIYKYYIKIHKTSIEELTLDLGYLKFLSLIIGAIKNLDNV